MNLKYVLIILYIIPLMIFLGTTIFAAFADLVGTCAYEDGTIKTCFALGQDYSWVYSRDHLIGYVSNWSFLVTWILLGGCSMYVRDWLKKRNA